MNDGQYFTANFDKKFALVWDIPKIDWVYLHDFSTGSLLKHGDPANLIFFNWNNFNYPTKTFQEKVYVWAATPEQNIPGFFFYDLKVGWNVGSKL